jgi:hypothetical protein
LCFYNLAKGKQNMNHLKTSILTATLALVCLTSANAANITVGNLLVERIGNGSTALSSSSVNIAVLEYSPTGTAVQTNTFTGSNLQTDSGSANSNGYLNSYKGFVAVTGHNSAAGVPSVVDLNNKVTSIIDNTGNVVTRVTHPTGGNSGNPPSPYNKNNYRSAIATSANTFYTSGHSTGTPITGGVWYYNGSTFTQLSSTNQHTNLRNIEIFNNQLYVSSGSGTNIGINKIGNGLATIPGQNITLEINMGTGANPYGFVMFDTDNNSLLDTAFIANDITSTGGGLQKWTLNGGAWANSYNLLFDGATSGTGTLTELATSGFAGIRGLTGDYNATTGAFRLFATTTETSNNRLVSILDNGAATPSTYTVLASAGTNYVFRGVDIMTVPEPSSATLLGLGFLALLGVRRLARKS